MPAAQFNRLCARCCTQHLTHTRSGKRHVEPTIGWLCVLRFNSEKSVIVAALTLASPMTPLSRLLSHEHYLSGALVLPPLESTSLTPQSKFSDLRSKILAKRNFHVHREQRRILFTKPYQSSGNYKKYIIDRIAGKQKQIIHAES